MMQMVRILILDSLPLSEFLSQGIALAGPVSVEDAIRLEVGIFFLRWRLIYQMFRF